MTRPEMILALMSGCFALGCAGPTGDRGGAGPGLGPGAVASATGTETSGEPGSSEDDGASQGGSPKLDVAGGDDGCDPGDATCCTAGITPDHELLDTFLLAYPAAAMPKSHDGVKFFEPQADGHTMAWSAEKSGHELVDLANGGLTQENLAEGRALARDAALEVMPADAQIESTRDEGIVIDDLGGIEDCNGVGWAWGSLIFRAPDGAMSELVYLFVGYCNVDEDVEKAFYSEQPFELCRPPG